MKKTISSGVGNVSASQVKELRNLSGASVMECREALLNSAGDAKKALEYLRKKGKEKARKKSGRETNEGIVAAYIHSNRKIGTLVEVHCETDFVAKNSEFQELAHDLAMHVAAMNPSYLSLEDVPKKEKEEFEKLVREEITQEFSRDVSSKKGGREKTAEIVEKIVSGKTNKYFEEKCLLSQKFVKNPEITIEDLIKEKISKISENIKIERIVRFEI